MRQLLSVIAILMLCGSCGRDPENQKRILIYTRNGEGYVHDNIGASVRALEGICRLEQIATEVSEHPAVFTRENLDRFDAIIFCNTNNEGFETQEQRVAFREFIAAGKGFAAIHSANATERDWPWYGALVGGRFLRHPPYQEFDVLVTDSTHPSTAVLPHRWTIRDECYYSFDLNPDIHILPAADLSTVEDPQKEEYPGEVFGQLFPLCWCHHFEGGRQWYTALGHDSLFYSDPLFVAHLRGGILWVLDQSSE
jgi:type 1 glutamine amidotransferase